MSILFSLASINKQCLFITKILKCNKYWLNCIKHQDLRICSRVNEMM